MPVRPALRRAMPLAIAAGLILVLGDPSAAQAPRFRADGRDAESYGKAAGYPPCTGAAYVNEQRCRGGALSDFDKLFPARVIAAPKATVLLGRAAAEWRPPPLPRRRGTCGWGRRGRATATKLGWSPGAAGCSRCAATAASS